MINLMACTTSSKKGNLKVNSLLSNLFLSTTALTDWPLGWDNFKIKLLLSLSFGLVRRGNSICEETGKSSLGLKVPHVPVLLQIIHLRPHKTGSRVMVRNRFSMKRLRISKRTWKHKFEIL